jgi:hypothetical protein
MCDMCNTQCVIYCTKYFISEPQSIIFCELKWVQDSTKHKSKFYKLFTSNLEVADV